MNFYPARRRPAVDAMVEASTEIAFYMEAPHARKAVAT